LNGPPGAGAQCRLMHHSELRRHNVTYGIGEHRPCTDKMRMTEELLALRRCIGVSAAPIRYRIDSGSSRFFADAIMDPDPAFRTLQPGAAPEHAQPVPPTFFGGATGLLDIPAGDDRTMFGIVLPLPQGWTAIASGDGFEFLAPLETGMVIVCHEHLEDAFEKLGRSGRLIFFTVVKAFTDTDGRLLLRRRLSCVARPPRPSESEAGNEAETHISAEESAIPAVTVGPVAIRHLAMFATATAEFVDIHYDADNARKVGLPGAIIQGLYKTALAARMLKDWTGDCTSLRRLNVQHRRMDLAGARLTAGGAIISPMPQSLPADIACQVWIHNEHGHMTTSGTAELTLPNTPGMALRLRDYTIKEHIQR